MASSGRTSVTRFDLVLFDCDGVLVDSEAISNEVLAEILSEHGGRFTPETALATFAGQSVQSIRETARSRFGIALPADWQVDYYDRMLPALAERVKPVPGASEAVRSLREAGQPICVASQGPPEKMFTTLSVTGLLSHFGDRVFSAKHVARPKPFPDLFLHAAAQCSADPARCAVIEDTRTGVQAGLAAGMQVFGFCSPSNAQGMSDLGAHPFHRMEDLPGLLGMRNI